MLNTLQTNELVDDRYLILKKLGKGGMSVVYRAVDKDDGKEVALKFLNPVNTLPYLELVVKFRNEVKVVSKLDHPNIIKFHATGDYNGIPYLVTEVLEGDSLAGLLKKGAKFNTNEAFALIGKVAEALHCVHSHSIIHRDVKPSNIFVVNSATNQPAAIKLLDFGLAHIMELSDLEKEKDMSGTFAYMSPEATGIIRKQLDERSDLYSVGVIFYYLLTNRLPFQSSNTAELLHQIAAMKAAPLHKLNPHLPDVIVRMVNRLLAKDQDERYQSAKGLLYDIEKFLQGEQDFVIGEKDRNELRLTYQTKLVGREEELTQIKNLINRAARKQGGICLIGGEPGVGKTRLVKAIKEYVYIRGYTKGEVFIESHCIARENKIPYQSFSHALDEFIQKITRAGLEARESETKRIQGLAGELGTVLIKLNPNLKVLLGTIPDLPALDPDKENIRFLITAAHFICNLVREDQVCILFLDDLQWADEGSLRLLEHIGTHITTSNLLILGTYRSNEVDKHHALTRIKKKAKSKEGSLTDIQIRPLTEDRVLNMVANLLKEKSDQVHEFAKYLCDKAGGNPFFTITLLKEIVEQHAIVWDQGVCRVDQEKINNLHLPNNIIDMMLLRTKAISKDLEHLLKISAVVGKEFKLYLLYKLIKKDTMTVMDQIDQAVKRNLLEYSLSDRGSVRFAHERIREAFLAKISERDRPKYHLRISLFLLDQYQGDENKILFELTYHLMEGGDKEKGLEYALRAGERARADHAHQDAITYYTYAKEILQKKDNKKDIYIKLLENLGESYRLVGRFDRSLEILKQCNELIPDEQTVRKSNVLSKMGDSFFEKGEVEKSFHALEQALRLSGIKVPQSTFGVHASLLAELGTQMLHTWFPNFFTRETNRRKPDDIIVVLRALNRLYKWYFFKNMKKSMFCHLKCLNLAEKTYPCSELVHSYMLGGVVWASIPWESKALRYLNLGVNTAKKTGDRLQEGAVYAGFSLAFLMLSKPREGLEYSKKSIQLLKGQGEYWDLGVAYAFRIQHCLLTGKLNESLAVSEEFIALATEAKVLQNLGWALMGKGKTLSLIGEVTDQTIEEIKKSVALLKQTDDMTNMLFSLSILACGYLRKKEPLKAIQTIEKVAMLFPLYYSNGAWTLDLFPLGAQIYLDSVRNISDLSVKNRLQYLKRARWFCKKSLKWSKKFKFIAGWTHQVNGTYNWLTNKKQDAIRNWEIGIAHLREQTEDTYRLGYILMEAGSFLIHDQDIGYQRKAKKYLAEAQNLFKEIGAKADYKKTLSIAGIKEQPSLEQESFHEQETTPQLKFSSDRKIMAALETSRYLSSILD
ncbi:MAG: hypothetical protein D3903_10820, partial [Candidatus Electrothrix sp. GM3_4]|nr:hypothetical protein [Candidatus Electrothrix sp. GM3_4]